MNAKYHRLQEKIQMLSKINKESVDLEEDHLPSTQDSKKSNSFTTTIPIPHFTKLEIRLKSLEELFESSMENIEMKHESLQEYITKLKAKIDSSAIVDDKDRDEQINQVHSMENTLMLQISEESNGLYSYLENAIRKTETKIVQIDNRMSQDSDFHRNECSSVLDNANQDIEAIASRIEELSIEQKKTNEQMSKDISERLNEGHEIIKSNENDNMLFFNNQYEKMKQMGYYAKKRNQEEAESRDEFKENIIKVLNETEESLNNY